MRNGRSTILAVASITGATIIAVCTAGCGWSARDAHFASQRVTVQSRPGDGSSRFSQLPEDPFRAQKGVVAADNSAK